MTPLVKRIADAILAADLYANRRDVTGAPLKAGQQVINAVWDAHQTVIVLAPADMRPANRPAFLVDEAIEVLRRSGYEELALTVADLIRDGPPMSSARLRHRPVEGRDTASG